jgi:hypothetical protein
MKQLFDNYLGEIKREIQRETYWEILEFIINVWVEETTDLERVKKIRDFIYEKHEESKWQK